MCSWFENEEPVYHFAGEEADKVSVAKGEQVRSLSMLSLCIIVMLCYTCEKAIGQCSVFSSLG
mgnify:CR=1 FL=1